MKPNIKVVDHLPRRGKYDDYIDLLQPGKALKGLEPSVAEGLRQALYKKDIKATKLKQLDGTYTVGIPK